MERLHYLDFELMIVKEGDQYAARVLHSPAGEAKSIFNLPFSEDKLEVLVLKIGGRIRSSARRIHTVEMEVARELGGRLFDAVFSGEMLGCFRSSLAEVRKGTGLRLKLRLQEVAELADLPWEFLFDPTLDRFLAQSTQTPIVRYVEIPESIQPFTVNLPLNVLVMTSSPADYLRLDVERERFSLKKAEEGVLVVEDDQGRGWQAEAHRIATLLHDHRSLRLVVLNSCEGARNSRTDPFAGMATTLYQTGHPCRCSDAV